MQRTKSLSMAAIGAVLASGQAWSASLHVSPVSLQLAPGQGAVGITLSNPSDHALAAQVRLFAWSQDLGEDRLTTQQELMVSPPIATIPAHAEQVVRIVRPAGAAPLRELTYRLLIDELPESEAGTGDAAVDIRIRYSVPLFVSAPGPVSAPSVSWALAQHDGAWYLQAANNGRTHAQLSAVKLSQGDGKILIVADGLLGYALAGSTREWRLADKDVPSADLHVVAVVNGHPMDMPLAPHVPSVP